MDCRTVRQKIESNSRIIPSPPTPLPETGRGEREKADDSVTGVNGYFAEMLRPELSERRCLLVFAGWAVGGEIERRCEESR